MGKFSERLKALRADIRRSKKTKKTPPASITSPGSFEEPHKTGFIDLPAEIRDEIYLYCFEENPVLQFARPQSPAESRIKKLISSRSSKTPIATKHGLLLVNRSISEGYINIVDKSAKPIFHVTTFLDDEEHMSGKAYWVTRPRMKEWLTSCSFHIDVSHCQGLGLYHVSHEIKSDFASFIWEYENLKSVNLTINSYPFPNKTMESREALGTIRAALFVTLMQHRPLERLCIRHGKAVQLHTRVAYQNGWWVKQWQCIHAVAKNGFVCEDGCGTGVVKKTWYCEDLHHLKEALCTEKCEEQEKKLDVEAARSIWLWVGSVDP
jgi:hypothetical protein